MIECLLFGQALGASLCADCVGDLCAVAPRPPVSAPGRDRREIVVTASGHASLMPEEGLWAQLAGVEDNRCAVEVKCVWQGYAVVTFRVGKGAEALADVVIGDPQSAHPGGSYGPYRFELVGLEPANSMAKPPPLSSYRARLLVSKGAAGG